MDYTRIETEGSAERSERKKKDTGEEKERQYLREDRDGIYLLK